MENTNDFSLLAVTSDHLVVVVGDNISVNPLDGSGARPISSEGDYSKPTLFQDIFGRSAFAENLDSKSDRAVGKSSENPQTQKGVVDLTLLNGPAHLLPPIGTLFDALMKGFSQPSTSRAAELEAERRRKGSAVIIPDPLGDIEMDNGDGGSTLSMANVNKQRRVNQQEMTIFTELFRTMLTSRKSRLYYLRCYPWLIFLEYRTCTSTTTYNPKG